MAIKVRFADFTTISRSQTLAEPTSVGQRIGEVARALFDAVERREPVRLIGVRAERLGQAGSGMTLWGDDADWRRVEGAVDDARARFGSAMITRARHLGAREGRGAPQHPRARGLE